MIDKVLYKGYTLLEVLRITRKEKISSLYDFLKKQQVELFINIVKSFFFPKYCTCKDELKIYKDSNIIRELKMPLT